MLNPPFKHSNGLAENVHDVLIVKGHHQNAGKGRFSMMTQFPKLFSFKFL